MAQEPASATTPGRFAGRLNQVAPGVHRLEHAYVNCYLIEDDDGVTLVDAAFPATWPLLLRALSALHRGPTDVKALVLTHAHFDHLGFARRVQKEWGVPVWAHAEEAYIAKHPYRYAHERSRVLYPIREPQVLPVLGTMVRAGALSVRGVAELRFFKPDDVLEVPGAPRVVFSPGHTFGHSALHFASRGALMTGDALVTFEPYTGAIGPRIVSGAATADSEQALRSLDALQQTGAGIVLPGHGAVWTDGIGSAVAAARAVGPS
jgi:glyoxylase-like metal-dependent hydrolase (beta-lactamase superfamily II)